ncbi:MAG: methionine gamma-lyase family protein [Tissierellia bacterium]|nr:methionine gamma-lyase family protein [Tissierellia bacterium]
MKKIINFIEDQEKKLEDTFKEIQKVEFYNQKKILEAMQEERLASTDFHWTTGYGYGDVGRDKLEAIYARVFATEDALVRPNIVSGTHAISLALKSLAQVGTTILSITGPPYDTLQKVLGIQGEEKTSLSAKGIAYREVPLLEGGAINYEALKNPQLYENVSLVILQRSTGYSNRRAFTIQELERAIKQVKSMTSVPVFVDNCYGEFTETLEPSQIGADVLAGSLIKNPGGGLAYTGGYLVGKEDLIQWIASELTAPGIGKECGLTFGQTRTNLQGLFLAPQTVANCLKGMLLFSTCFEELGYTCVPSSQDPRSDIVQAIALKDKDKLLSFCRAIQATSPVDSHVTPYPWDMPGYEDPVIMAAGGFIEGSSIELSADGPLRAPYWVYLQGSLTYSHCKLALIKILEDFM